MCKRKIEFFINHVKSKACKKMQRNTVLDIHMYVYCRSTLMCTKIYRSFVVLFNFHYFIDKVGICWCVCFIVERFCCLDTNAHFFINICMYINIFLCMAWCDYDEWIIFKKSIAQTKPVTLQRNLKIVAK